MLSVNIIKPTLDDTTRKSRIENLYNSIARANKTRGYKGCNYDTQVNTLTVYID